jgi:hypothetical protein
VAEYGALTYETRTGRVRDLLSPPDRKLMDRIRHELGGVEGTILDPEHRGAVRAYRFDASGRRHGLGAEAISAVLRAPALKDQVRVITGAYQTDFIVNTINKAVGLRALAKDLGVEASADGQKPFALAVGDGVEDLPMFGLATLALAPANGEAAVRAAGVEVLSRTAQAGLSQGVARLIGHTPGSCSQCQVTHLSAGSRLLLAALGVQDRHGLGKVVHALRLASRVFRTAL